MKKLLNISVFLIFTMLAPEAMAQGEPTKQESQTEQFRLEDDENKVEINARELPEQAREDIVTNYHNAEVMHAYKIMNAGEMVGYLAQVKKGTEMWYIRYDEDGNPENKVTPQGI